MATLAERVTTVEDSQKEHRGMMEKVQTTLAELRGDMNRQFGALREDMNRRFAEVREDMNRRSGELRDDMNRRFEAVDRRFEAVDRRFDTVDRKFDQLDAKVSRQFVWLVGVQMMTLAAVVTSMATILSAIIGR